MNKICAIKRIDVLFLPRERRMICQKEVRCPLTNMISFSYQESNTNIRKKQFGVPSSSVMQYLGFVYRFAPKMSVYRREEEKIHYVIKLFSYVIVVMHLI